MDTSFLASSAEGHLLQVSQILRSISSNDKYPENSSICLNLPEVITVPSFTRIHWFFSQ